MPSSPSSSFSWLLTIAAFIVGSGTAIVIVTAISTIALYWAYGVPIFLGVDEQRMARAARLEPGPVLQADRVVAVFWIVVLIRSCSCGRRRATSRFAYLVFLVLAGRLLLRLGAPPLQGPDVMGEARADRDRARVRARGRGARRRRLS